MLLRCLFAFVVLLLVPACSRHVIRDHRIAAFAHSPLTQSAEKVTLLALAALEGRELPSADIPVEPLPPEDQRVRGRDKVEPVNSLEVLGFTWQMFVSYTHPPNRIETFKIGLVLTAHGLQVLEMSAQGSMVVPQGPAIEHLDEALAPILGALRDGEIERVALLPGQCREVFGENACRRVGVTSAPANLVPEVLARMRGDPTSLHIMRMGPVVRTAHGKVRTLVFRTSEQDGEVGFESSPLIRVISW